MKPVQRPPSFARQAVLIVLPVLVLTGLGLLSLRQDRLLAEQEARERAGGLAQQLADRTASLLFGTEAPSSTQRPGAISDADIHRPAFEIITLLELASPPPLEVPPRPRPRDPAGLSDAARTAWDAARRAAWGGDQATAYDAWAAFRRTEPPPDFSAEADYELAQLAASLGRTDIALSMFDQLAGGDATATLESGLAVAPLARWRATELRLARSTNAAERELLLHQACSNLVFRPTALTPDLLDRVGVLQAEGDARSAPVADAASAGDLRVWHGTTSLASWKRLWQTTTLARGLFAAACVEWQRLGVVGTNDAGAPDVARAAELDPVWVELPDGAAAPGPGPGCDRAAWLLTRSPAGSLRFIGRTECEITNLFARARTQLSDWPAYFGAALSVAGNALPERGALPFLAERTARESEPSAASRPRLAVTVFLADAGALYAHQRQRTWWFLAVVLAAAATAGVGLVSAHRAFQRQLRLNEMKSSFVSSVSHELRAPIASVRLLAESLERGRIADEAKRRDYFRLIGQECRRLSSLVENVLDFSRIDQGRKQYEFEPTDVLALVTQTVKLMEPYAAERRVALQWQPPPAPDLQPTLDGKAIQQALVNLIDNAVKHAPPGSAVAIALATVPGPEERRTPTPPAPDSPPPPLELERSRGANRTRMVLSVTDRGPGIPRAEHERIFEPFYRRGSELRRETTGVGIGLTIVKHVAEAHGGRVLVESEPGQGSRFVLELPLCRAS